MNDSPQTATGLKWRVRYVLRLMPRLLLVALGAGIVSELLR